MLEMILNMFWAANTLGVYLDRSGETLFVVESDHPFLGSNTLSARTRHLENLFAQHLGRSFRWSLCTVVLSTFSKHLITAPIVAAGILLRCKFIL